MINNVDFLLVHYAQDLESLQADGLLGLAPNAPPDHPYNTLVQDLYDNGVIDKNMFSLYLAYEHRQSKIWFGGYSKKYLRQFVDDESLTDDQLAEQIRWAPINTDYYWSTQLVSASVGEYRLPVTANYVIYDSGSSLCYVPINEYNVLMAQITRGHSCSVVRGTDVVCSCQSGKYDDFPTI